jgi:hypothetical protein
MVTILRKSTSAVSFRGRGPIEELTTEAQRTQRRQEEAIRER